MEYIGVDLAWSENHLSGVALIKDNEVLFCDTMLTIQDIASYLQKHKNAKVGIDAPLLIPNQTGNREIEKLFLKDYSSKKLGVYPVNKNLLADSSGNIRSETLVSLVPQKLGISLFEVYPHVTILECFHGKVLPYKRKKGRSVEFVKEQLKILQNYLTDRLAGDFAVDIDELKGKTLKHHEDKLDAIVCAYTMMYCENNSHKLYGDIFMVPR